ncbi:hemerythrin domain-containing protein [uncultured Paludibaculum sp.]|uniref:hemerythrin domain-containing protein n=1 Tax=uncultured Paludibaculum sp. TaxID=1765020 RepID=UPI002AAAB6FD|nr:hemerythrin domain-containing protein [uncultured Paludibaculum sp.]
MIRAEALFAKKSERSTLDAPLDHLKACHRRIEERLDTMERAAARLETHRDRALEAFESAFHFMDTSGVMHTEDEELSVFPRLRPLMEPGELSYLAGLEHEHTEAHRLYTELKDIYSAPGDVSQIKSVVSRLATLYRAHIQSEDKTLQGYAAQHLVQEDLAAISAEMKARRNPAA